jgi:hypothetical protein
MFLAAVQFHDRPLIDGLTTTDVCTPAELSLLQARFKTLTYATRKGQAISTDENATADKSIRAGK